MFSVVSGDSSVCSLGFDGLTIGSDEDGSHETQRSVTLSEDITLDITVVVLAGPDKATAGFQGLGDHIVDQTMLVPDLLFFKLSLVVFLVDLLEDILETTVVSLKDGVLGGHVQRPTSLKSELEARMGKSSNRLIGIVHGETYSSSLMTSKSVPKDWIPQNHKLSYALVRRHSWV